MYNWETIEKIDEGSRVAVFRRVDEDRDMVVYTTIKKIVKHLPFSKWYTFLSTGGKVYKVKKRA